jgi:DNA-binding NarL/FixJ family response regulator
VIRVLLADDHPVVRQGLAAMLGAEPDLDVVGEASSGPQAEALSAALRPDIVLMDLRMPDGGGVESIERMTAAALPCRVIVLTTYETDGDILRAVEAGAAGYLLKDVTRTELADAIRAAARGETVLAPSVAARLVDQLRTRPERPRLSDRETAVLRLVAEGCTNADRPPAVHRRVHGEDPSAARLRQVGGRRPYGRGDERDAVRAAVGGGGGAGSEDGRLREAAVGHTIRTGADRKVCRAICAADLCRPT